MSEKHLMDKVTTGQKLYKDIEIASQFKERDFLPSLQNSFFNNNYQRVSVIRGLRRTGKTMAMYHLMSRMTPEQLEKTAYITGRKSDNMDMVYDIIKNLDNQGYKWIFFDEVTKINGFIDNASIFSDVFSPFNSMKFVLSGTDSLGLCFTEGEELFDRCDIFSSTYFPFQEYNRLKGSGIDEFIESGGILSGNASERLMTFKGDYALQAICFNIQRSLEGYEDRKFFMDLTKLYSQRKLTGVINKVIQSATHAFLVEFLNSPFKSRDIGSAADLLRKEKNPEKNIRIFDSVRRILTEKLMKRLSIKDGISVSESQAGQIEAYLEMLDLIIEKPVRFEVWPAKEKRENIIVQPGLRWAHAVALVDEIFKLADKGGISLKDADLIKEKIHQDIKGNMLEEIVILDTMRNLSKIPSQRFSDDRFTVFQQRMRNGEIDMIVRDSDSNTCAAYEIKYSETPCQEQGKHLRNQKNLEFLEKMYGKVIDRKVLSRTTSEMEIDGVGYKNVEDFLKNPSYLPELFDEQMPAARMEF